MDTQSVGQTVQALMQIDVDGDGTVDVERLYDLGALRCRHWETFTTPNTASSLDHGLIEQRSGATGSVEQLWWGYHPICYPRELRCLTHRVTPM